MTPPFPNPNPVCPELESMDRFYALVMDYTVQDEPRNTTEMMEYIRATLQVPQISSLWKGRVQLTPGVVFVGARRCASFTQRDLYTEMSSPRTCTGTEPPRPRSWAI